jgi:glyoxylase-like metal-dependent hydrolase (beta-lactamase superfamily II)
MYPEFEAKIKNPSAAPAPPRPSAQPAPVAPAPPDLDKVEIQVLPVQGNVYLLVGAGGNTIVQVGEYSVLVVDTQLAPLSAKILAAIKQISAKPIRYIVNTSFDPDHTGGNGEIAKAGNSIGGQYAAFIGEQTKSEAAIIAQENVLSRMSAPTGAQAKVPFALWPTETYATPEYQLFNGEGIEVIHEPAAHTDGDSIVFFRRSDVISTGDVFSTFTYPVIDRASGGTINGMIAALNHLIRLSIPRDKQEGGTYVIPGHGRICDQADVVEYRDMVTIIRDRIEAMVKDKMTLDQVKAARPTLDYDGRYGVPTPYWTKEKFIEAVYADLSQSKKN